MGVFLVNHPGLVTLLLAYVALLILIVVVTLKEYRPMTLFAKDLIERALRTFVQVFFAAVPAGSVFNLDVSAVKGAALAAGSAALSLVMSLIAKRVGDPGDASLVSGTPEG